ncbi:MAG TPA: ISAzo13 family transposase [Candidatus Nanoarchaeia archaeon]|nr:ISAzo13 family transposase [Candidatus Nanoarchaeia archaeon]
MEKEDLVRKKLDYLSGLNEVDARHYVGLWAIELGWGGISQVNKLTGKSMDTIRKGIHEIKSGKNIKNEGRLRKEGGGRKKFIDKNPSIKEKIEIILEENTAGDPMSILKWTNKSTYTIAHELEKNNQNISEDTIGRIIKQLGYSLQANVKSKESGTSQERDSQFKYINEQVKKFAKKNMPVISVDTKKKELVGNFKNNGRKWQKKGKAEMVNVYDFEYLAKGKAIPYGIYEVLKNHGFVNVGISHDTSEFAVESIRQWWKNIGKKNYPSAKELLICADSGGSNASRSRLWKFYLQKFANKTGLKITVCHLPPGTSKWNKIEHKMFSFISINWKGKPLRDYEIILNLIEGTKTKKGLKIKAKIDRNIYEIGKKISEKEFSEIKMKQHKINPRWNYTLSKV